MASTYVPAGVRLYSTELGLDYRLDTASWSSEMNVGMKWSAHIPEAPTSAALAAWEGKKWFLHVDAPAGQADWTSPPLVVTDAERAVGTPGRGVSVSGQDFWAWEMEQRNNTADSGTSAAAAWAWISTRLREALSLTATVSYHSVRAFAVLFTGWHYQLMSATDHLNKMCALDASYWISTGANRAAGLDVYQMEHSYSAGTLYIGHSDEKIEEGRDLQKIVIRRMVKITNPSVSSGTGGTTGATDESLGIKTANIDNAPIHGYSVHAIDNLQQGVEAPGRIKWFAFYDQFGGNVTGARVVRVVYPYPEFDGSFTDWPAGQTAEEPWRDAYSYRFEVIPQQGPAYPDAPDKYRVQPLVAGVKGADVPPAEYAYGSGARIHVVEATNYYNDGIATVLTTLAPWMLRFANRDYYTVTHHCRFDPWIQPGGYVASTDNFPQVRIKRVECNLQGGAASMSLHGFKLVPA